MKSILRISIICCFLVFNSCYEELDFDQINEYIYKPVITSSLTFFSVVPGQFFNAAGVQETSITSESDFRVFEDSFVKNDIVKIDFNTLIKNEFDRGFTINVSFLDDNNTLLYQFTSIVIPAGDLENTFTEEVFVSTNPAIVNTTKVRIRAELEDTGTNMNPNDTNEFELKSSVILYIESEL
jgi:hypothetical protein